MKKLIFNFLLLAGTILTTNGASAAEIKGTLTNGAGKKLYLEKFELNRPVKIDSVVLSKKGAFKFMVKDTVTEFYRISFQPADFIVLILAKTDKAEITGDATNMNKSYTVKGSAYSAELVEFVKLVNGYIKVKDSLTTLALKNNNGQNPELVQQLNNELNKEYATFLMSRNKFLDDHPTSPSLVAVTNHLNMQNDMKGELVNLKKIEAGLKASVPNSYYYTSIRDMVLQFEQQIAAEEKQKEAESKKAKMYEPGTEAQELVLNDPDGKEIKLSSLKGKYVLIDFWASWCGPCRKENPNVVKLYNKYKDNGFTIYSVSLDRSKDPWVKAIKDDGLIWPNHVSDLKYWQSDAAAAYGVNAIPFTVLIDKEGKIVQANLRGPSLESKLKEIFGF